MADTHPEELQALLPAALLADCVPLAVPKGDYLFRAGRAPSHMFYVTQGEVVLERAGLQGASVILQRCRRGFVSEASLQSARYHCDGLAVTASQIVRIPVGAIRTALQTDPAFSGRWIDMLNKEVRRLRLQCERLALPKVQDRLTHLLDTEGKHGVLPLGAGIKSLAGELGVTHEALYRSIYAMEKAGRLRRTPGQLELLPAP